MYVLCTDIALPHVASDMCNLALVFAFHAFGIPANDQRGLLVIGSIGFRQI
jgi:hypothetical protein